MVKKIISANEKDTQALAQELAHSLSTGRVIALKGELGAGKTTFAQGLGKALGIDRMTSPTYTLIREYPIDENKYPFSRLYHIDLYRLDTAAEVFGLGINEIWFDPKSLVLIEWPESIVDYLPKPFTQVTFKKLKNDQREIKITDN